MARFSLVAVLAMVAAPGCLIVGEPEPDEPTRGQPQLIEVTPTSELILLRPETGGFQPSYFEANLVWQDVSPEIQAALLINYGNEGSDGSPWESVAFTYDPPPPPPGQLLIDLTMRWTPSDIAPDVVDCKRVTLVVSHSFFGSTPFQYCPAEENDVARLTWFVALCGSSVLTEDCSFDACSDHEGIICPPPANVQAKYEEYLAGGN